MVSSEPDWERHDALLEQGAGKAVAGLKAGFGVGEGYVPPGPGTAVPEAGRMEQAVERGRQMAEAMGAAAPEFPAAEVAANFQMAADAGALPVGVGVAASDDEVVDFPNPAVEQGDGFYWMGRTREENEEATYWRQRCMRAEAVNPLSPSELEEERDHWLGRARKAETRLRDVSRLVAELERLLKGILEGVKDE